MTSPDTISRYLYLGGIKTSRKVRLREGLELMPASPSPALGDTFYKVSNITDLGILCLYLPMVSSQLFLTRKNQKDLAILTWNCAWDMLLIGALFQYDPILNMQGELEVEQIKCVTEIKVTNYHLQALPRNAINPLSENDISWIEEHHSTANKLLSHSNKFSTAVHCLSTYLWHTHPRARLSLIWSGIESLFGVDSEISYRISLYVSHFLHPDCQASRIDTFETTKKLYNSRSKAVHGCEITPKVRASIENSAQLLRSLLFKCIETNSIPDPKRLAI